MHLTYGAAGKRGQRAPQMYAERYPNQREFQHQIVAAVHKHLCETGSFTSVTIDDASYQPKSNQFSVYKRFGALYSTIWRILNEEHLHSFLVIDEYVHIFGADIWGFLGQCSTQNFMQLFDLFSTSQMHFCIFLQRIIAIIFEKSNC